MHIEKRWVSHFGLVFGERMETNSAGEKVKKERIDKISFKNAMHAVKNDTQVYY